MLWNDSTPTMAPGDYASGDILWRTGDDVSSFKKGLGPDMPIRGVNYWKEITFVIENPPLASEYVFGFAPADVGNASFYRFIANLANARALKRPGGVNPAASWTMNIVNQAGTLRGTMIISVAGAVSFTTAGGALFDVNPASGEGLWFVAPATADASIRGWQVTVPYLVTKA